MLAFGHRSTQSGAGRVARARLLRIMISPHVLVGLPGEGTTAHISAPWVERIPFISEVVDTCTAFRIECDISDDQISRLVLTIHEDKFRDEIGAGEVGGEAAFIGLVCAILSDAFVPGLRLRAPETGEDPRPHRPPAQWREDISLYPHQLQSLAWMRKVEGDVRSTRFVEYSKRVRLGDTGWLVDADLEMLVGEPKIRGRRVRGGILADGTGTGKTAVALRLMCEGASADEDPPPGVPFSYRARGTLVIVPINLPAQWVAEIEKFTHLRVARLLQGRDMKHLAMDDLLHSDVVLTTFHFLRSIKYSEVLERTLPAGRRTRANIMAWSRLPGRTAPVLEAVFWERVVVDEIHEVFESSRDLRLLRQLNFRVCWGLSATPASCEFSSRHLYFFLSLGEKGQHEPHLLEELFRQLVRGAPSGRDAPVNTLRLVELTAAERILLQAHRGRDVKDVVELCSALHVGEDDEGLLSAVAPGGSGDAASLRRRLTGIRTLTLDMLRAGLREQERSIRIASNAALQSRQAIDDLERSLDGADEYGSILVKHQMDTARERYREQLLVVDALTSEHQAASRAAQERERSHKFLTSRIELLERHEEVCSVCMERRSTTITHCGHLFCRVCVSKLLRTCPQCPECRSEITDATVHTISTGGIGSKLSAIAQLVRHLSEPVIMFAQWKSIFKSLKSVLRANELRVLTLEGNTTQRANALSEFSDAGGALLLSMDESFAGLHLPCAKHIIFSHALLGAPEDVKSMETQAIARALRNGQTDDVRVYSFIVSDCVEEELWWSTRPDNNANPPHAGAPA